jgi:hypothetical protein
MLHAKMLDPANVSVISDVQVVAISRLIEDVLDNAVAYTSAIYHA